MPRILVRDPKANYNLPTDQSIRSTIGAKLRELRKQHGMAQIELAKNIGKKSAAYIAFIESGERNITATDLSRIAFHLKVRLSYFYP